MRIVDGLEILVGFLGREGIPGANSTGVHQCKFGVIPFDLSIVAVPGYAREIAHQCIPGAGQAVKQCRFAYVGSPYNGCNRFHDNAFQVSGYGIAQSA